jgi:dihydrofolate reductase
MKLLLAVSQDGFLCRGPDDDMRWTGPADKAVFRLLTMASSSPLFAGKRTAAQMPKLPGRRLLALSTTGLTLHMAAMMHPDAWLIGGPTVAMSALRDGLIKRAFLCHCSRVLGGGWPVEQLAQLMPPDPSQRIRLGDVDVLIFTEEQKWPGR